ncbi:MAG TPA: cytochrome c class I [Bacilli bacterium]|nr:cytochrome c class I [Bacilli bacterium]
MLIYQAASLIPKDLELVIPGNIGFFEILIVVSFLLHILFVNIAVAGSVFAVVNEIRGIIKKDKVYDVLAFQLATQTSILKSIAVVLGVAPLLLISVIYTQYFYPATILVGKAWLSLIVLLIVAFLLLYAYKFSWERLKERRALHLAFGLSGSLILLFVPLIFITSVVSMLYPEMWAGAKGFFHSLFYYPQIWQRYFHFMLSSFAVTGLAMYIWNRRKLAKHQVEDRVEAEQIAALELGKKFGIATALWTTALQLVAGTLLLISLKTDVMMLYMGGDALLTAILLGSILISILLIFFLFMAMRTDAKRWFNLSLSMFVLVIALMGWMRHEVRESYIKPYEELSPKTVQTQNTQNASIIN